MSNTTAFQRWRDACEKEGYKGKCPPKGTAAYDRIRRRFDGNNNFASKSNWIRNAERLDDAISLAQALIPDDPVKLVQRGRPALVQAARPKRPERQFDVRKEKLKAICVQDENRRINKCYYF
jgi:hypothetical protein